MRTRNCPLIHGVFKPRIFALLAYTANSEAFLRVHLLRINQCVGGSQPCCGGRHLHLAQPEQVNPSQQPYG